MRGKRIFVLVIVILPALRMEAQTNTIISYNANPTNVQMFWKNDKGAILGSLDNLVSWQESKGKKVVMAMNGGMYMEDRAPLGLYIENGKVIRKLNTVTNAYGNFYMQPNGVFYISKDNKAVVCETKATPDLKTIKYATQSGPLLVVDGVINDKFTKSSKNVHIRNGVGVLPDGRVLFAISKTEVNLYDIAEFFKNKGCRYALFLDGFVSRAYIPSENFTQKDGNFGVMIAVTE